MSGESSEAQLSAEIIDNTMSPSKNEFRLTPEPVEATKPMTKEDSSANTRDRETGFRIPAHAQRTESASGAAKVAQK